MACVQEDTTNSLVMELLLSEGSNGFREALEHLLNEAMLVERSRHINATPYERSDNRTGLSNGFKPKSLKTRLGSLSLKVPQVRDSSFYPTSLDKGSRVERALLLSMAEMYVQGVSTRKVSSIVEELCGLEVSSTEVSRASQKLDEVFSEWRSRDIDRVPYLYLDARYEKVRQGGTVVDCAVLIAVGVSDTGKRSVLGVSVSLSEQEAHWRQFLENLLERGMSGVELVISDAHSGLKAAKKAVLPSVPWQRCQFHLQQNSQAYVPKQSMKREVASRIRAAFNAPNRDEAQRQKEQIMKDYESSAPKLAQWLEENLEEGFTIFDFPEAHRRKIRTTNMVERLNKEIKRRTKVASLFPNEDSCLRLVTAIVMETSDEWETGRNYLNFNNQ